MKYRGTLKVVPNPDVFGKVNFHILNTCFPKFSILKLKVNLYFGEKK